MVSPRPDEPSAVDVFRASPRSPPPLRVEYLAKRRGDRTQLPSARSFGPGHYPERVGLRYETAGLHSRVRGLLTQHDIEPSVAIEVYQPAAQRVIRPCVSPGFGELQRWLEPHRAAVIDPEVDGRRLVHAWYAEEVSGARLVQRHPI